MKTVCQLDQDGFFVGMTPCQPSPLEPGVYLIPGGAIDIETAPNIPEGKRAKWDAEHQDWEISDIPVETPEVPEGDEGH